MYVKLQGDQAVWAGSIIFCMAVGMIVWIVAFQARPYLVDTFRLYGGPVLFADGIVGSKQTVERGRKLVTYRFKVAGSYGVPQQKSGQQYLNAGAFESLKKGQPVRVRYVSGDPSVSRLDDLSAIEVGGRDFWVPILIFVGFIAPTLLVLWARRRDRRPKRDLFRGRR